MPRALREPSGSTSPAALRSSTRPNSLRWIGDTTELDSNTHCDDGCSLQSAVFCYLAQSIHDLPGWSASAPSDCSNMSGLKGNIACCASTGHDRPGSRLIAGGSSFGLPPLAAPRSQADTELHAAQGVQAEKALGRLAACVAIAARATGDGTTDGDADVDELDTLGHQAGSAGRVVEIEVLRRHHDRAGRGLRALADVPAAAGPSTEHLRWKGRVPVREHAVTTAQEPAWIEIALGDELVTVCRQSVLVERLVVEYESRSVLRNFEMKRSRVPRRAVVLGFECVGCSRWYVDGPTKQGQGTDDGRQ